jgi:3-isopropylmalate/(R)-2-methylmalate dehydratase small subunit
MTPFTRLDGRAAALMIANLDTDQIIPKQFLKTVERDGLGKGLFYDLRFDGEGREKPDFVLNQKPFAGAHILIGGENFGCGSSREHAPWALLDFGIRCVIAPSFADIFYGNMFKNGMLPIRLPASRVNDLIRFVTELPGAEIVVDLENQTVTGPDELVDAFDVPEFSRHCLLNGLDEIGLTFEKADKISAYEKWQAAERPWL